MATTGRTPPDRKHADGVDHCDVPRCARPRGERAADHRDVGGVAPVHPASDSRADRDGEGRRELRGPGNWQRPQPRKIVCCSLTTWRSSPSSSRRLTFEPRPAARDRDVPRPEQRDEHRAWQAAVPQPAGDDPPGQSRAGLPNDRGAGRRSLRVHVRRQRRDADVCADTEHGDVVGRHGALGPGPGDPAAGGRRGVALGQRQSGRAGEARTAEDEAGGHRPSSRNGRRVAAETSRPR